MSMTYRRRFLMACACCVLSLGPGLRVLGDETNLPAISQVQATNKTPQDLMNALLQIQEQLHTARLLIESNRVAAAAETQRNAVDLTARLQVLEQTVAAQRADEIKATQKAQRFTLILAGAFGVVGLTAMLLMAYFQWRTVARLVELSTLHPSAPALEGRSGSPPLPAGEVHAAPGRAAVQLANGRLFNVVERLERRLLELEQTARAPLVAPAAPPTGMNNGAPPTPVAQNNTIAEMLAEGQLLLNNDEPEQALERFDQALALDPKHAEALVRKAGALEKLNRFEEAITCYDAAIEADGSMTIAYLHKGGLFNRMSRYEEALQCYERALHTHDQRTSSEKTAA